MNRQMFGRWKLVGRADDGSEPVIPAASQTEESDQANRHAVQWRNSDKSDASEDGVVNNLEL